MNDPEQLPYLTQPDHDDIQYVLQSLSHPNPEVRAEAITCLQSLPSLTLMQRLVELLNDQDKIVCNAAADSLWSWSKLTHPVINSLAFALRYLRDAIQGSDTIPLSNQDAWRSFYYLRYARPAEYAIFNYWCLYTWCHSDKTLLQYSHELYQLHQYFGSFFASPSEIVSHLGIKLLLFEGQHAMGTVREAIRVTQGRNAAYELDVLWENISTRARLQCLSELETSPTCALLQQLPLSLDSGTPTPCSHLRRKNFIASNELTIPWSRRTTKDRRPNFRLSGGVAYYAGYW